MAKIYRSAQGKTVDVDQLRLKNEETIAVGNMKVNARGDELGPGGVVVRTRNESMDEYYASNAIYTREKVEDRERALSDPKKIEEEIAALDPDIVEQDADMPAEQPKLRGNLADAVAKSAKVEPKILTPKKPIQRI